MMKINTVLDIQKNCLIHNKPIVSLCASSTCMNPNIMVCSQMSCIQMHSHSSNQFITINNLRKLIQKNGASLELVIQKVHEYFTEVKGQFLFNLQNDAALVQQALRKKSVHPVLKRLKQMRYNQLSGKHMRDFIDFLDQVGRQEHQIAKNRIVKAMNNLQINLQNLREKQQYQNILLQDYVGNLITANTVRFNMIDTQILNENQFQKLQKMLIQSHHSNKFKDWKLLYRASLNNYDAQSYRKSVQGRVPTLTIIKTTKNRKFGAFMNTKLFYHNQNSWVADATCRSFIFSLDYSDIYPLKSQRKFFSKAAFNGTNSGPQIGSGCDIYIKDRCNEGNINGSNLGGSFELPQGMIYGSQMAQKHLAGQQLFQVAQYEVFLMV